MQTTLASCTKSDQLASRGPRQVCPHTTAAQTGDRLAIQRLSGIRHAVPSRSTLYAWRHWPNSFRSARLRRAALMPAEGRTRRHDTDPRRQTRPARGDCRRGVRTASGNWYQPPSSSTCRTTTPDALQRIVDGTRPQPSDSHSTAHVPTGAGVHISKSDPDTEVSAW